MNRLLKCNANIKTGRDRPCSKKAAEEIKSAGVIIRDGLTEPTVRVTKAAVREFQHSSGLPADGIAGPQTLAALGLETSSDTASMIHRVTVEAVNTMFPFTPSVNIATNLPFDTHCPEKRKTD